MKMKSRRMMLMMSEARKGSVIQLRLKKYVE